jgi:hypothetical protein
MPDIRFLLDANMPRSSAELMRSLGFDVEDVRDIGMMAASDRAIIQHALKIKKDSRNQRYRFWGIAALSFAPRSSHPKIAI